MKKFMTKKKVVGSLIFGCVFGLSMFEAYRLTPANVVKSEKTFAKIDSPSDNQPTTGGTPYFNNFSKKFAAVIDEESNEELGLRGKLNNVEVKYPTKDGLSTNFVRVGGEIDIMMRALDDFDFSADLAVNYNNKTINLGAGFIEKDLYLSLDDLRIKSTYTNSLDALDYVYDSFFNPENEEGLGIDLRIEEIIGDLFGGFDLSGFDVSSLKATETTIGDSVLINLNIGDIGIDITVDQETLALQYVDLGTIKINDVTISGAIEFDTISKVIKPDDTSSPKYNGEYVEAISYLGWADKLLDLFQTRKLGLDLSAQISLLDGAEKSLLADISSSVNLDCSKVFDFNNLVIGGVDENGNKNELNLKEMFDLNKLEFGVDLETKGQKDEVYANVNLSYFEQAAYLTLNENTDSAVMRAKLDNSTLSSILEVAPNLVSAIDGLKNEEIDETTEKQVEKASDDIFSFITSSDLIKGIKNNDFSGILNVIKNISNDSNCIYLDLSLASLGLGANSEVNLVLNASKTEGAKVLKLDVKNVVISKVEINLSLASSTFSNTRINAIKAKKDSFDDLSFIPGVINQVSSILNEKKGYLTIDGSIMDENNEGTEIEGVAQFDANEKIGYGTINMRQYASDIVNSNKYLDHKIDFDINNKGSSNSAKNALFVYNKDLKAKFTLQTFVDIIDLFKDLINSDDERFTKFGDLLSESLLGGALQNVISSKDYLELAKASYIKSIKQNATGSAIDVTISGSLIGMDNDIMVSVNFKTVKGEKKLRGLTLSGIEIGGKFVDIDLGLEDYDDTYKSPVNKSDNFMDFSQVKVLLDFGINTTKINYYHLTAKAQLKLSVLSAIKVDLDFHIHVDGKKTRVYGSIPKVPWITDIASQDLGTTKVSTEFVFEPVDDIGGVFHIVKNKDKLLGKDQVLYYQSDSKNFVENILQYLIVDMLNIRSSVSDSLTKSISTEKSFDPNYAKMFTSTGFKYSKNASGVSTWNIGLNMDQLLGNDALGSLEIKLNGVDEGNSGLFTDAHVEMGLASILTIVADIDLVNPSFETQNWPNDVETKYNKVLNYFLGMSASQKADFEANYKNNPAKEWKAVEKSRYF